MNLQKYNKFIKLLRNKDDEKLFIDFAKKLGHPNSAISRATGIITPNGKFKFCLLYKHKDLLLDDNYEGIFDDEIILKQKLKDELREEEHQFARMGDGGGHVPWHSFYSEKENEIKTLESKVLDKSYENNYCRFYIGKISILSPSKSGNLYTKNKTLSELEGKKEVVNKYKTFFEDLSMIYKAELFITEVDYMLEDSNGLKI